MKIILTSFAIAAFAAVVAVASISALMSLLNWLWPDDEGGSTPSAEDVEDPAIDNHR